MHVLFVHQNFPAQFGHIAAHMVKHLGWRCTFVSERKPGVVGGIEKIQYTRRGGATVHNLFYTRSFETAVSHAEAVYRALKARPDIKPDLLVGHSGFGSTVFLPELIDAPIINFFEYYYHAHNSDMDFRPDSPVDEMKTLRSRVRNAMILLDLQNCDAAYTPTLFQRGCFPELYQPKIRQIFDGVDTRVYRRISKPARKFAGRQIPPGTRIITYCSRGFEKMRGFDIFMKAAKIIYQRFPNVIFLVAGTDRVCYGGDVEQIKGAKSFRHWLLAQDDYDLSKFIFVGWIPRQILAQVFSVSDVHIYLTVPFVLSWSMMNALACGAVVVGSDTAPVQEMIVHGENGFLADFFEAEAIAAQALAVLREPRAFDHVRENAIRMIKEKYSLEAVLPQMLDLYRSTVSQGRRAEGGPVPRQTQSARNPRPRAMAAGVVDARPGDE